MTSLSVTTGGVSSARVDPQGHTRPCTDSRDDAEKEREDEFLDDCRLKARWINVAICFGVELQYVFKVGMRLIEDYGSDSSMDEQEKAFYVAAYKGIIGFIPGLKRYLPVNRDGNSDKLYKLLDIMQKGSNTCRSDTMKRINQLTDRYLNSGTRPIQCNPTVTDKRARGLDHPQIGRLFIPASFVAEWDKDPEASRAHFHSGKNKIMGYDMPVFLYFNYEYNPKNIEEGLFRGAFLVCVLVDILYGPQAVDTAGAKRAENNRHNCVGDMYDAEAITPQMIAYAAVVARFALSARRMWNNKEDSFEYQMFYQAIITQLSDLSDPWADETIRWWNMQVFGNEKGKVSFNNQDDREQEARESFAQRKAARKAAAAAANTRAYTPESLEMPADEDEEHIAQQRSSNSPGDTTSGAGSGSAIHNTPSPSGSIDPHLSRVTHPNDSRLTRPITSTPTSPEREPSPLSSPPDEETSPEPNGVPSSFPRKRKAVKNKGKAPLKRRKTGRI